MNCSDDYSNDYCNKSISSASPSYESSKIPKLVVTKLSNTRNEQENRRKNQLNTCHVVGFRSRIPIKKSLTTPSFTQYLNRSINKTRETDPIKEVKSNNNNHHQHHNHKNNNANNSNNNNNNNNNNGITDNDIVSRVKRREVRGRSCLTSENSDRSKSDPIDYLYLRQVLDIVRSDLSGEDKLLSIKRYRDKRLGVVHPMEQSNKIDSNERTREWVDSGYISNSNNSIIRRCEDAFIEDDEHPKNDINSLSQQEGHKYLSRQLEHNWVPRSRSQRSMDFLSLNRNHNSFNSDISFSSISSIESLLEARREDPEELLLALGFGYVSDEQSLSRIPQRFLESPSMANGVNLESFIRKNCSLIDLASSFSSASFSLSDSRERSYSYSKCSDKMKNSRILKNNEMIKSSPINDLPEIIAPSQSGTQRSSFSESILDPANREFLDNQGKNEDQKQLNSKRLIIGTKSYSLDIDGDPLVLPRTPSPKATTTGINENKADPQSDSCITENVRINNRETNFIKPKLQRQRHVSSDDEEPNFSLQTNNNKSLNEISSELSSSTITLVDTVKSITSTESYSNDLLLNCDKDDSLSISSEKRNASCQTENQMQYEPNTAEEAVFVVAIQSLKLSLEFYKHHSLKLGELNMKKYEEHSQNLTEEDAEKLKKISHLREKLHFEVADMELLLNQHLDDIKNSRRLSDELVGQAQTFIEIIKKMIELLKEQQNILSRYGFKF